MPTITPRSRFVIFKDEPDTPVNVTQSEETSSSASSTTVLAIVTARDKENLHPVTGRRSSTEDAAAKKPKTRVLATKLLKVSRSDVPEPHPSPKKRRLFVSSETNRSSGNKEHKKEKRSSSVPRAHKTKQSSRSRKMTELPKVEEEEHVAGDRVEQGDLQTGSETGQAAADSKCYELTVLPLADVSKAFEQSPPPEERQEEPQASQHEETAETSPSDEQSTKVTPETPVADTVNEGKNGTFSTPERKRIYSAFTFESPSPASKRYATSTRGSNVERFSDLDFDPVHDTISIRAF
ncbi:hypothetical protein BC835DRAFT_1419761 [Cytidiella melzeri]|nr:hypothetical protein BC835DRAFT_1419761 [Cytidiella melzeri]